MNICEGCSAAIPDEVGKCDWLVRHETNKGDCPCTDCLIKMMCKHACHDFRVASPLVMKF